jgi:hypothetical protein
MDLTCGAIGVQVQLQEALVLAHWFGFGAVGPDAQLANLVRLRVTGPTRAIRVRRSPVLVADVRPWLGPAFRSRRTTWVKSIGNGSTRVPKTPTRPASA